MQDASASQTPFFVILNDSMPCSSQAPSLLGAYIFATPVNQRIVCRSQEIIFILPISPITIFSSQISTLLLTEERKKKKEKEKKKNSSIWSVIVNPRQNYTLASGILYCVQNKHTSITPSVNRGWKKEWKTTSILSYFPLVLYLSCVCFVLCIFE